MYLFTSTLLIAGEAENSEAANAALFFLAILKSRASLLTALGKKTLLPKWKKPERIPYYIMIKL